MVKELLKIVLMQAALIKIELIEAGTKEIKVIDNGVGMHRGCYFSFSRHATSKILDEDDLYAIQSLGFRGEACPQSLLVI